MILGVKRNAFFAVSLLLLFLPIIAFSKGQVVIDVFDWDDNIANMPTKIVLFHKKTGKEVYITSAEYALERHRIGKSGDYEKYEERTSLATGSLRNFADEMQDGKNHFLADLKSAMKASSDAWKGPSLSPFVTAMKQKDSAESTYIVTARLHNPNTIYEAVKYLKSIGIVDNVLPVENIWPVLNPKFAQRFRAKFGEKLPDDILASSSARKAAVMQKILNLTSSGISKGPAVMSPEGNIKGQFHLFAYSDDDFGNFSRTLSDLQKEVDSGRWQKTKITLYFTGHNHPSEKPKAVVLRRNKSPRRLQSNEQVEWEKILSTRQSKTSKIAGYSDDGIEELAKKCGKI